MMHKKTPLKISGVFVHKKLPARPAGYFFVLYYNKNQYLRLFETEPFWQKNKEENL